MRPHHLLMTVASRVRSLAVRVLSPVRLGARMVPVAADGRLLYVRHSYMPGWFFPGGAVDQRETTATAAARELSEETGLTPTGPARLVGVHYAVVRGISDHVTVYAAPVSGEPRIDGWEIVEARWAPPGQPPEPLDPSTREQLAMYCAEAAGEPTP